VLFSDESHFFVEGKYSTFIRIRKSEQLSPAHYNEAVKYPQKKMFRGSFRFSGIDSALMPVEGIMNSEKYCTLT